MYTYAMKRYTGSTGESQIVSDRTADQIFGSLLQEIVSGCLAPGEPLSEQPLAARFGVSRTPVREALHRLEQARLAERGTRRAFVVRQQSMDELERLFEAAGEIEGAIAALAALRMSEIERRQLAALLQEGEVTTDPEGYAALNLAFHAAIRTGARNDILAASLQDLNLRTFGWRDANFRADADRMATSHIEHAAIAEAIIGKDAQAARQHMRSHVATAFLVLAETLSAASSDTQP